MDQPSESGTPSGDPDRIPQRPDRRITDASAPADTSRDELAELRRELDSTRAELRRLRERRSVRAALKLASIARPLFSRRAFTPQRDAEPGRRSANDVAKAIRDLRPKTTPTSGPLVSIVIPTRDGFAPLSALLSALDASTTYRSFELIIIDNGSSDASSTLFDADWSFPLRVIYNKENASFSRACNQGVKEASGEYVLLLNNDVLPINNGWLGALVSTLEGDDRIGAAGALLVYPDSSRSTALSIQHRGIGFDVRNGELRPTNLGRGEDPTDPALIGKWETAAATAACLLIPIDAYRSIGGLDEKYVYGTEDVDLCLSLRSAGYGIVVVGDAAMFHEEFATQRTIPQAEREAMWLRNLTYFAGKWGARVWRSIRLAGLDPTDLNWATGETGIIGITLTDKRRSAGWGDWYTAHELGHAFEAIGWSVRYVEVGRDERAEALAGLDVLICLLDNFDPSSAPETTVKIAWMRNWTDRWLDRLWIDTFDAILPSSTISASLIVDRIARVGGILPLATNPERFHRQPKDETVASDYVMTANLWGEDRSTFELLDVRPSERFALYGKGWERDPDAAPYWRGSADYDLLPSVYSSAAIVLDDTASPTLPYGALNSRVFDALACGTLVLTDNAAGSAEVFDGHLPSFETALDLRALLDRYLKDPESRDALACSLREQVIEHHTYTKRAPEIIELARDSILAPRVAIRVGVPNAAEVETWGDTHFARAFAKSLRRLGFHTRIDILPDWDAMNRQDVDIVVHVRGLSRYTVKPGHLNVLWVISHPDDVTDAECELYDLVLVASAPYAAELERRLTVPVHAMLQATDPDVFFPDPVISQSNKHGLVFVGNSRKQHRAGVLAAVESGLDVEIYGGDWDGLVPAGLVRGGFVPNDEVGAVYSRAKYVLSDHWPDMAKHGFISNRIFDAAASGALILSDPVIGMEDLFGELVPTYSNSEELCAIADDVEDRADHYASIRRRARDLVVQSHTFDRRALAFADLVHPMLSARP